VVQPHIVQTHDEEYLRLVRAMGGFAAACFSDSSTTVGSLGNGDMERVIVASTPAHDEEMNRTLARNEKPVTSISAVFPNVKEEMDQLVAIAQGFLGIPEKPQEAEVIRTRPGTPPGKMHIDGFLPFLGCLIDITPDEFGQQPPELTRFLLYPPGGQQWSEWDAKPGWYRAIPDDDWAARDYSVARSHGPGTMTFFHTMHPHQTPGNTMSGDRLMLIMFWRLFDGPGDWFTDQVVVTQDVWNERAELELIGQGPRPDLLENGDAGHD